MSFCVCVCGGGGHNLDRCPVFELVLASLAEGCRELEAADCDLVRLLNINWHSPCK